MCVRGGCLPRGVCVSRGCLPGRCLPRGGVPRPSKIVDLGAPNLGDQGFSRRI